MTSVSDVSSSGATAQFQAAATSKALDVQKQEGESAIKLIESSTETDSSPGATGNIIDIEA
jgi:hypothetical protein